MRKAKTVPAGTVNRLTTLRRQEPETLKYGVDGKTVEVQVRNTISLKEACRFVQDVASAVFQGGECGAPVYRPELYAYAVDRALLSYFTNVKTRMSAARLYDFCQNTNIMEAVQEAISQKQYYELLHAVEEAVEDLRQKYGRALSMAIGTMGRAAPEANEALTLEELRGMTGEPVWVQYPGMPQYGRWVIVAGADEQDGARTLYCQSDYSDDYGKTWLAYRRPPEGGEG